MTEAERHGGLDPGWLVPPDDGGSYLARWQTVVASCPDVAVARSHGRSTTYAEADLWATAVAHTIDDMAGGPGPVALVVTDAAEAIVALIGAIRAGRPLVPLDAATAPARNEAVLELSRPALGLHATSDAVPEALREHCDWVELPGGPATTPGPGRAASRGTDDVAALLFTSGSTGRPKGVRWRHATLLGEAAAAAETFGIGPGDRVGLALPPAFAAGFTVLEVSAANGATLAALDPRESGIAALADWIDAEQLTTLHGTPTLLRALVAGLPSGRVLSSLRLVTCSGEPLLAADVEEARPHLGPDAVVVNWCGASEVGTIACRPVRADEVLPEGPLPAGSPPDGKRLRILDDDGRELPPGTTGELVVESRTLSGGYVAPDAEQAARFHELPDGACSYRTGDLGRLSPDGTLELRGRKDDAVKIGGYLVEPAEVESALRSHPTVAEAVVLADRSSGPRPRLVAYVGLHRGQHASASELRRLVREQLPTWMVPSAVVFLPELPRNERGKIDRTALPAPPGLSPGAPPRTPVERALTRLWEEVLGVEQVGIHDDFVALGGDSLAAVEMLAGIAERFDAPTPTTLLLEAPTIAELAERLDSTRDLAVPGPSRSPQRPVVLRRDGPGAPIVMVAGAGGVPMVFGPLTRSMRATRPAYALANHALEERGWPDWTVASAARRHLRELRSVQPHGPYVLVGHSLGGLVALEMARRLGRAGEEVPLVVMLDSHPPGRLHADAKTGRAAPTAEEDSSMGLFTRVSSLVSIDRETPGNVARVLLAGPVQFDGQKQYDAFYRRGMVMVQLHRPTPYPGRVLLVTASDEAVTVDAAAWNGVVTGLLEVVEVRGDHHAILREPYVEAVAALIDERLAALDV